jgi:hypothetical protein
LNDFIKNAIENDFNCKGYDKQRSSKNIKMYKNINNNSTVHSEKSPQKSNKTNSELIINDE